MRQSMGLGKSPLKAMSRRGLPVLLVVALGSIFVSLLAPTAHAQVTNTFVYHQISSFTSTTPIDDGPLRAAPILSGDGQRIAFGRNAFLSGDALNHIFVVNFDGTGQTEVDTYTAIIGQPQLDISANGAKVISADFAQLRIANGDGSGALPLIAVEIGGIAGIHVIAISGDGSKVFFIVGGDTCIRNSNPCSPVPRGLWVINADGSGRRQLVSAAQLEELGVPPNPGNFNNDRAALASSMDGSQIVFGAWNGIVDGEGQGLFGVNLDGTGLHDFLGRVASVTGHGGISSDGMKVFYDILRREPVEGHFEMGVINFDGTGQFKLADSRTAPGLFIASDQRVQISADGSVLLIGGRGILLNTDGSGMLQLAIQTPGSSVALGALLYGGTFQATMNRSATRFSYFADLFLRPARQLATLEINPDSLGDAPSITNATIDPPFVLTGGRSAATVSANVSASNPLDTVGNTVLLNGLDDVFVGHTIMIDDGTGTFTNLVRASSVAVVGPRTVRVQSGVPGGDGKMHATAVEFGPFAVLENPPAASPQPKR